VRRGGGIAAAALGAIVVAAGACGTAPGTTVLHDLHLDPSTFEGSPTATKDFYALPFPNDLRRDPDGSISLDGIPRIDGLLADYVNEIDAHTYGFGLNAAVHFRLDAAVDPASLPAGAAESLVDGATAFLVDVTPGSPTYGKRSPVRSAFRATNDDFIGPNWIALLPVPGVPLREKTTYAAILTDGLRAADGGRVRAAPDLVAALDKNAAASPDPRVRAAAAAYAPLTAWLAAAQPDLAPHIVGATVFTTQDATSIMFKLRAAVYAQAEAPVLADLADGGDDVTGTDHIFTGTFRSPNFQVGAPPYNYDYTQGGFVLDANGVPQVQRMETLRVAMTIPVGDMPPDGWPVILYAHGTGGSWKSFINDGSGKSAANVVGPDGSVTRFAMISIDQVLHGPRVPEGTNIDLAFFNLTNLAAARTNPKQGAVDDFQLLRLVKSIDVAQAPGTGQPIKFDPKRIYFKGHSQGGLTGPLFLAAEPEVPAAILSGAGGGIIHALLGKTKPQDIPGIVSSFVQGPVDEFHPILSLVQTYVEDTDPINYARCFFREPPSATTGGAAMPPKSIFQSLGITDHYTPIPVIKALALAMGVQPIGPQLEPIDDLELAGLAWGEAPVAGNVAGGKATGVLLEYNQRGRSDGHFVIFDVPEAVRQSNRFLATHATGGVARLEAP
jgi:predicted esterase